MSRGHNRERQVKKILEERGWFVIRAPGSLGIADLVALKADCTARLIEVKSDDAKYGPFNNLSPQRRKDLLAAAEKAGARAQVAYWPSRGELEWIEPKDWPK